MPVDSKRVEAVFLAALDQSDRQAQVALLDRECAGDSELRKLVEELLKASQNPDSLLDGPAVAAAFLSEAEVTQALAGSTDDASARIETPTITEPSACAEGFEFLAAPTKPGSIGQLSHYEIREVIGRGGFGTVFKTFDEKLHRIVAIKVLAAELAANGSARKRFIREAQAAAAIKNEHVVAIYNVEDDHQPPFIVMEMIDGMSLQDRLDKEGSLDLKEILRIGVQIAEGLAAAHKQGLIHRDIKPANILLENGVQRVKITDFGLARLADDASITQSGVIAGTPMYMAPEQAMGDKLDPRADLFSLGSVLYALCTGRGPFRAANTMAVLKRVCEETPRPIREVNPELPDWLGDIITKLHAKQAKDRYQTAREVADVLGEKLAEVQFTGRANVGRAEPGKATAPAAATRPRRALLALATVVVLALASVLAVIYWPRNLDVPNSPEKQPLVVPVADKDGWVQLFNGKDLTGWMNVAWARAQWKVENGHLVVKGAAPLLSTKKYKNYHARFEVKATKGSWSAVGLRNGGPGGDVNALLAPGHHIGGIWLVPSNGKGARQILDPNPKIQGLADTWMTVDAIVVNKNFTVSIDGVQTATLAIDQVAEEGQISVFTGSEPSEMAVRKIEIKELPPEEPGWVQLFNGRDLTGWRNAAWAPTIWRVESGNLVSKGHGSVYFDKPFKNFHCRIEVKTNKNSWGGLCFRGNTDGNVHTPITSLGQTGGITRQSSKSGRALVKVTKNYWTTPDTWLTVEVIVIGKNVTVRVDGTKTAELPVEEMAEVGDLFLTSGTDATQMTVRKIEIKELPPTPPADTQPFVVLAKDRRAETRHATLADAVTAAQSGDTIEIRSNGPFITDEIVLDDKALTIRAGKGIHPILCLSPRDVEGDKQLLKTTTSSLVLEGLDLQMEGLRAWDEKNPTQLRMLRVENGSLHIANCKIAMIRRDGTTFGINAIVTQNCPHVEMRNCFVVKAGPMLTPFAPPEHAKYLVENCVLKSGFEFFAQLRQAPSTQVSMRNNTIAGWSPCSLHLFPNDPDEVGHFEMEWTHNIFAGRYHFGIPQITEQDAKPLPPLEAEKLLRRWVSLKEKGNVYSMPPGTEFLQWAVNNEGVAGAKPRKTLAAWELFWDLKDTGSVQAKVRFKNIKAPDHKEGLTPDDYRLVKGSPGQGKLPGGTDIGADVNLVGPGPAYERWQQTPAYQEWRKRTETLLLEK